MGGGKGGIVYQIASLNDQPRLFVISDDLCDDTLLPFVLAGCNDDRIATQNRPLVSWKHRF